MYLCISFVIVFVYIDPIVCFSEPSYNVCENNGPVQLMLNITTSLSIDLSVQLSTTDGSAISKSKYVTNSKGIHKDTKNYFLKHSKIIVIGVHTPFLIIACSISLPVFVLKVGLWKFCFKFPSLFYSRFLSSSLHDA